MPFTLWGWAMLLVIVLSAAPTSAHPRTRLIGSAFDPATVSVLIGPRKERADEWGRKSAEGDPGNATFGDQPQGSVVVGLAEPRAPITQRKGAAERPADTSVRRPPMRAHAPTGPPLI